MEAWSPGRMSYDLRRLRLHGLIERILRSRRYRVTAAGIRTALCYQRPMHACCVMSCRPCSMPIHPATAASSAPSRCSTAKSIASGAMIWPHNLTHPVKKYSGVMPHDYRFGTGQWRVNAAPRYAARHLRRMEVAGSVR